MKATNKMASKDVIQNPIKIGTLFSGIGAFEHALKQLGIEHEIIFACDNGERELPLTYRNLQELTKDIHKDEELFSFCEDYINKIGVRREFRETEASLMYKAIKSIDSNILDKPVVLTYSKTGRKSPILHKLSLTQDFIVTLTSNMTTKEREQYVKNLYDNLPEHNYVKDAYFANYPIQEDQWHEDIRFFEASEFNGELDILVGGSPCQSFSNYGKKLGLEDVRGTLFYEIADILRHRKPKVAFLENVRGLISHDKGKTITNDSPDELKRQTDSSNMRDAFYEIIRREGIGNEE